MGMLYRRKKLDPVTGKLVEQGPWWVKYYDGGKPIYETTRKLEKRDALTVLRKAEAKVAEGQREGPVVKRTRFEDLIQDLKAEYTLKGRKTWKRREQHLAHLKPVFGGIRVTAITTERLKVYVTKRLSEKAAPATINRELDCLRRMMVLGQRHTPPKVLHIPHFPKLTENNVREGFCDHEDYLCIRGAAPYHIQALGFEPALPEPLAALWHKDISVAPLAPEAGALKAVLLSNG